MSDSTMIELTPEQRETLPIIPLLLCAKAEGIITDEETLVILQALRKLGISEAGVSHVMDLLQHDQIASVEMRYLFVLRDLLDDPSVKDTGLNSDEILRWSARVSAATKEKPEPEASAVTENEAVMLHTISKIVGGDPLDDKIPVLETLIGDHIPKLTQLEVKARLGDLLTELPENDGQGGLMGDHERASPRGPARRLKHNPHWELVRLLPIDGIDLMPRKGVTVERNRFLTLLAGSVSLSIKEKSNILLNFPVLNQWQVDKLITIFEEEIEKFLSLEKNHWPRIRTTGLEYAYMWLSLHERWTDDDEWLAEDCEAEVFGVEADSPQGSGLPQADEPAGGFLNLSNHPSGSWSTEQRAAAVAMGGGIIDLVFPQVNPESDLSDIELLADRLMIEVPKGVSVAMVMGESVLVSALVSRLQTRGVRCVAATTRRASSIDSEGKKTSRFSFVDFRDYPLHSRPHSDSTPHSMEDMTGDEPGSGGGSDD